MLLLYEPGVTGLVHGWEETFRQASPASCPIPAFRIVLRVVGP